MRIIMRPMIRVVIGIIMEIITRPMTTITFRYMARV